MDKKNHFI